VPRASSASSFDTLRAWSGSQARAFEELSYQLLKSSVPTGSQAIRTGNPDGGVEWYAAVADGKEWGWQAKHVHGIDALLTAMSSSVQRVVRDRPKLVKLTFVISWNLAASTRGGARISQRQKFENKVARWKATLPGAAAIEFELIQESDLLTLLAKPEHRGRAWFWWAEPVLGSDWLAHRLAEQSAAAGERYRPDLQVDLPIEDDLKALGAAESVLTEFDRLRRQVITEGRELRLTPRGPKEVISLYREMVKSAELLATACSQVSFQAGSDEATVSALKTAVRKFLTATSKAEQREFDLDRAWQQLPSQPEKEKKRPPAIARDYSVRKLRNAATELETWLESSIGRSLLSGAYFLVGPAGSGKTHLFLDGVRRALDEGRPAVVLFGARFGHGDLWASVCDQLGLETVGEDVLLGAMDAAGEAAAKEGRRFVLLVDALNETVPPDFWVSHLPVLRAAVAQWPHVALAVSCRDTYVDVVDEGAERRQYVNRTHPGFAGHEVEATQKYFDHFGLEAPRIPLLVPEFSVPLFLRLYCESLRDSGKTDSAVGHEGRVRIFERYLDVKLNRVARRLRPAATTGYEIARAKAIASKIVEALLDEFATTGREGVRVERGEELATTTNYGSSDDAAIVLGALQSEGILTRELLYLGGDSLQDGFRVVFQAFADYLILRRRLNAVAQPMNDAPLRQWLLRDCSSGIIEAATVSLPELFAVELPDFLGVSASSADWSGIDDQEQRRLSVRVRNIFRSLVETLPYRDAKAVSPRTVELLNQSLRLVSPLELFRAMFLIAPQPSNRLNAEALHRYLKGLRMPRRDASFGVAVYREIFDESSPAATLARWAARGPYPNYDAKVVELSCVALAWLLSSPNRFMRDWVTKAMVQLLRGHLDVACRLFDRFWEIDDRYVIQRVVVIAYGALMRSEPADAEDAKKLASRIRKVVFARPMRADELMLDAARGVVEWGVAHGVLPKRALSEIKRPYGIGEPSMPPSEATLEKKYGFKEKQPDEESYNTIRFSLISMGDFGRYVVESGVHNFSRFRFGEVFPKRQEWPKPRIIKSRWRAFEQSLSETQLSLLRLVLKTSGGQASNRLGIRNSKFLSSLTKEQSDLLHSVSKQPKRPRWHAEEYPADRARRWVFRRTLSLGWTPQLFGSFDRSIGYGRAGREAHKAERWGKKYQWMAYHELLARVADNFQPIKRWADVEPYEGLHQIIGEREIDSSLPPVHYRELVERSAEGGSSWRRSPLQFVSWPPGQLDFTQFGGSIDKFLANTSSEPTLDRMTVVNDEHGEPWVLLHAYQSQGDPSADKRWLGLQQPFALNSWLAPTGEAALLLAELSELRKSDRTNLVDDHGHVDCCYAGEIGWNGRSCYHRHADFKTIEAGGQNCRLVSAVETVTWEGSLYDCSIEDSVFAAMPSTFIQSRTKLILDERGPSWRDQDGEIVLTNYCDRAVDGSRALLVRGSWLQSFLKKNALVILVAGWFERRLLSGDHAQHYPSQSVYSAALIDSDLSITVADPVRESHE
jgi:hypothetical protein